MQTACGCADMGCEMEKIRETEGVRDRTQRQEVRMKDRQPEKVTECSPARESVWINVKVALAKSSVNQNL